MMLVPARKSDFLSDFLSDPFDMGFLGTRPQTGARKPMPALMKTDIKETEKAYELAIEMPGFKKENVQVELSEGYLTISGTTASESEESSEDGPFLRKERFNGNCRRSFYVGDDISEDDIRARFEDGILKVFVPKKEILPPEETKRLISIEG